MPEGFFSRRPWVGLAIAAVLITGALITAELLERPEPSTRELPNLHTIEELRRAFNADAGTTRLILLLSPT